MTRDEFIQQQWVKDEIISRLDYNPDTGSLTWAERGFKWFDENKAGQEVGHKWVSKDGYKNHTMKLEIKGKSYTYIISRLCWLVQTGDWPEHTIDHINRDSWDNRWCNLRDITQKENNFNKGFYKGRVFKHVSFCKDVWLVRFDGKLWGFYKCLGKAVKARDRFLQENL